MNFPKKSILIVEDEQITALDIQSCLERAGYQVAGRVDRGETAIQKTRELFPDLVLMDIKLKGEMDGIKAALQIYNDFNIPVIFLTAYANQSTLERARLAEPFGYILKPFNEQELISNIEIAIYKHSMAKKLRDSETRFRSVFEYSMDGFVLSDSQGYVIKWNSAAERITGLQRSDVVGRPIWEIIFQLLPIEKQKPEMLEKALSEWRARVESGFSNGLDYMQEQEIITPQGLHRVIQSNGFSVQNVDGILAGAIFRDVTENQAAAQALRESEERLRVITAHAPSIIIELSLQGQILFMSRSLSGYTVSDMVGKNVKDWIVPEYHATLDRVMHQVIVGGEPRICETCGFYTREDQRWYLSSFAPVKVDGQIKSIVLVLTDITERKLALEKLSSSEARLRTLIENSPDIVLEVNSHGEILFTNYFPELYLEKNIREALSADQRVQTFELIEKVFESGLPGSIELQTKSQPGWLTWDLIRVRPVKIDGKVDRLAVIMTDITERKKTELELLKLSQALDQSANVVVVTDLEGNIEYANPKFTEITGFSLMEAVGKNPRILRSGKHPVEFYQNLWQTITSGHAWHGEFHNLRKDGLLYWEDATITPVFEPSGKIVNFIAVKEDITARKALEAAEHDQRLLAEALRDTALALSRSLKLDEVLDRVLENVGKLVIYDAAMVLLIEGHTVRKIRYHNSTASGTSSHPILGNTQANLINLPILQEMRETRQPCLIPDTQVDPRWRAITGLSWVRSFISAPVETRGEVTGLINLVSAEADYFSPIHAERLMSFASQAAIAIENAQLFEQAHMLAVTDHLTELNNRRYFYDVARVEFERHQRYGGTLSVMLIDIDHFKNINDTYGHAVGDAALRETARRIKLSVRIVDLVARYGGEEFVVLMPETGLREACQVAERVRKAVGDVPFFQDELRFSVSLSVGVAEIGPEIKNFDALLLHADQALYAAKETGRNRVECYHPEA